MTEGSKLIKTSDKPLSLKVLKEFLNTLSEEELNNPALLWKISSKKAEIKAFRIHEIYYMTEDHINPSGDGIEPISMYDPGEMDDEPVVVPKGSVIFNISK